MTTSRPSQTPGASLFIGTVLLACAVVTVGVLAQTKREVSVTAVKHQFRIAGHDKAEIHVTQDDLVRVTLTSQDVPHSFALPDFRIHKRVELGKEITFEFRAEKAGRFEFHCSMTADSCRERGMVGALIVAPKR